MWIQAERYEKKNRKKFSHNAIPQNVRTLWTMTVIILPVMVCVILVLRDFSILKFSHFSFPGLVSAFAATIKRLIHLFGLLTDNSGDVNLMSAFIGGFERLSLHECMSMSDWQFARNRSING